MGKKIPEGRQAEFEALKGIEGIVVNELMNQIGETPPQKTEQPPVATTAPATITPPAETKPTSEAGSKPDETGILKEIFGDQFTSVEDLKKINIPERLKEVDTLRQQIESLSAEKEQLSSKLSVKPKTSFANDDVALFNEFVRNTGIKSFDVFSRLNSADMANMDDMDAIVLSRLMENPNLASKEPQLRKHIEKTFNVDPESVEEEELEVNKIGLAEEGYKAKLKLQELKGKLKLPEPVQDEDIKDQKWTPEQETQAKTIWSTASRAMGEKLSQIPLYLPGSKEPLTNFVVSEDVMKAIESEAINNAVGKRMDASNDNITNTAKFMYSEIIMRNFDKILHTVFEKARSLTDKEVREKYHNPSPIKPEDSIGGKVEQLDERDEAAKKIFEAEMGRI
jgi:hypothetical protein